MSSSWLKDFENRLDSIKSRKSTSPLNTVNQVALAQLSGFDPNALSGSKELNGVGEHLLDLGGRALDVVSRPGYAVGSFLNSVLDEAVNPDEDVNNPLSDAWEGFTGKRKEFFHPWKTIDPYEEGESSLETGARTVTDFLASILGDPITYIPGGQIIKGARIAGDATGLTKLTDAASAALKAKNGEQLLPDVSPLLPKEQDQLDALLPGGNGPSPSAMPTLPDLRQPIAEIADRPAVQSGPTMPPVGQVDEVPEGFIGPQGPTMPPVGRVDPVPPKLDEFIQKALDFNGNMRRPAGTKDPDLLAVYSLVRNSISQSLRGVRGKFNESPLKDAWKPIDEGNDLNFTEVPEFNIGEKVWDEIPVPVGKTKTVTEKVPARPFEESARMNVLIRNLRENAPKAKGNGAELSATQYAGREVWDIKDKKFYFDGEEFDPYAWARENEILDPENYARNIAEGHIPNEGKITVFGPKGHPLTPEGTAQLDMQQMLSAFDNVDDAVAAKMMEGITIGDNAGNQVPFNEYVKGRTTKWQKLAKGSTVKKEVTGNPSAKEIAAYEKAVAAQQAEKAAYEAQQAAFEASTGKQKFQKPNKAQLEEALRTGKIRLSKAERKKLLNLSNLGNKTGFDNAVAKMAAEQRVLDIQDLRELAAGVKSGRIDPAIQEGIWNKLGAKTLAQAEKKLQQIDDNIARLSAKVKPEVTPENIDEAFDPAVIGDVPKTIPDPALPKVEATQNIDNISENLAEKAIDETVPPPVAAELSAPEKLVLYRAILRHVNREWQKQMPHRSPRGARKTDKELFVGDATWWTDFNMHKQANVFSSVVRYSAAIAKRTGQQHSPAVKYDKAMAMLKGYDEVLRSYGIHPTTMVNGRGYPISIYDILSSLPRKHVEQHVFNTGRQILPTQYLELAHLAMNVKLGSLGDDLWGGSGPVNLLNDLEGFRNEVKGSLYSNFPDNIQQALSKGNNKSKSAYGYAVEQAEKARDAWIKKADKSKNWQAGAQRVYEEKLDELMGTSSAAVNKKTGSLRPLMSEDFVKSVQEKVRYNSERAKIQYGEFVKKANDEVANKFIQDITRPGLTNRDVINLLDERGKLVKTAVRDADILPPPKAADTVDDLIEEQTANVTSELARKERTALENNPAVPVGTKSYEAMKELLESRVAPTADLGDRIAMTMIGRMVHNVAPHIAEGPLRSILLSQVDASAAVSAQFSRSLGRFEQKLGKPKVKQMFEDIRVGAVAPDASPEYAELNQIISRIFDDVGDGKNYSLAGHGISPKALNPNLRHFKVDPKFHLKGDTPDEAYRSWRDWDTVEDPMDLLSRYHAAVQKTIAEKTMGESISYHFGSQTPKPGHVKVSTSGGSKLAHVIDLNLWYPKEIVQNMRALDKTLRDLAKPGTSNRLLQTFDSVTHMYKAGLTIYRPGHHMRNLYGDMWLGFMDGVTSPRYYSRAMKVMSTRKEHYKDYTFNLEMGGMINDKPALTTRIRGKEYALSNDDVYRLAMKHGLLPDYHTIEDLGIAARENIDALQKTMKFKPFGGKVHNVAADVSEYRDHWVRMAHFIKVLEEGPSAFKGLKVNNIEDLAQQASFRVRQWHPNGADLTNFERNVARRTVLFYSWIRKAIPLVVSSTVLRPGRILAFPKAMYTIAESNGIDLNGFTDPFPTDQLFPQWLGGMQGPQFGNASEGYLGMRMGVPMMDIFDQYFTSPGETFQTIMGATHPAIKIPYELSSDTTTQGIPIKDTPKYLLGQVPFGNFVNTMVGKPIGQSASDEGYDPGGIRDPKALATINLLTGLGLMDMSKPSYIKSGEFDLKYGRQGG